MYLDKSSETKWLIKSENKILGPYNFDQLTDLIRKKQISLIDEIRDPETRWLYVRECSDFKSVVEEMRQKIDATTDSTKTYQSISKTVDEAMQNTKSEINQFTDINMETKDIAVVNEILAAHAEVSAKSVVPPLLSRVKFYSIQSDVAVEAKAGKYFNKMTLLLIAGVAFAALSIFGYMYFQKRNAVKYEEELARQIKTYKYLGFYQKAADMFSQMPVVSQKKLIPELLEIYPLLESLGLVSKDNIEVLKSDLTLSSEQKADIELIHFRLALQKNNFEDAQDSLVKAAAVLPASLLIKENEALLFLKKSRFGEAFKIYRNIFSQEKNGRYLLGTVQSFFGLSGHERSQFGKELLLDIEKYTSVYYDYKKELLLAQMALASELNEVVMYKVSRSQYFNTPCRLSEEFRKPLLLAGDSYRWKEISEISSRAQKNLNADELILFRLHDYLELNHISEAADFLSGNQSKVNSAAIRAQLSLLLLDSQKRNNEVVTLEKSNKLDMNSELNQFLIAKNKIELDGENDIAAYLHFLNARQQIFYRDWLELEQLVKKKAFSALKIFLNTHFITTQNFNPVYVAKSLAL